MADSSKERRINPRSLENLKLGAEARYQGKVRRNTTLLPETIEWLEEKGNVSEMIDQLVAAVKNGQSNNTYNSTEQQTEPEASSNHTHDSTIDIAEISRQAREIQALIQERDQLRTQLEDMAAHAAEWYEKAKECNQQLQNQENSRALLPDLDAVRDRVLQSLKLGKQAPEYKRTKVILERFIQQIQQQ